MRKTYSYNEAVKILGGKSHPVVAAMDKIVGGALLAGSLGTWQVLDLFDAKPDFTRLFSELATKVSDKRRGLNRYDRTQRLLAAHTVVVVTAYFEAFRELPLPFSFTREDDEHVVPFSPFEQELTLPSPALSHESNLAAIFEFYVDLDADLLAVTMALAAWDELNETDQGRALAWYAALPDRALRRYQELFAQLAIDCPELAFWCSVEDHRATRAALARLEDVLREAVVEEPVDVRITEMTRVYGAVLQRPLVQSDELRIPVLGEAYVDPRFQLLSDGGGTTVPSALGFWESVDERSNLYAYLAGYLTSDEAWRAPLLVLGDPGSGKSVLTEVLAARLSATGTPVVRVELRNAPADAGLSQQIEHGLWRLLEERVAWPEFSRSTRGAVPVVMLDGLDELMQATGVSQSGYLMAIEEFQRKLLLKERPAVVVVTSRLSVCAGLGLPRSSHVVRLLPFSDDQVRQWLEVWNKGSGSLPAEVALEYRELSRQPLLLLMLALYDAVDGALRRDHQLISQGQLYERLLESFARREVAKSPVDRTDMGIAEDVEFELDRLSVVALAMFNRGVQWVTAQQVSTDLAALLGVRSSDRTVGERTPLSSGELALGRFFFVQKAEAVRGDDTKLATYEFLHATFGEYLVARFVWRTIGELSKEDAARSRRKSTVDDTELYSVLSFMALTTSKPVLDFLREFAAAADRDGLFDLVVRLLELRDERRSTGAAYEPVALTWLSRDARYAVNLVVLTVLLRDKVYALDLRFSLDDWRSAALFWKSRLSPAEWASVVGSFWMERDQDQHFSLSLNKKVGLDAEAGWLAMSEPYVTLDEVALKWREALTPLTSRYPPDVAATLVELSVTPAKKILPVLDRLFFEDLHGDLFKQQLCMHLGYGGDDLMLLERFSFSWQRIEHASTLEAWLRLHESGFPFPEDRDYPDVREMLEIVDVGQVCEQRPDLFKRAKAAAAELGLELPSPGTPRVRRDRPR